MTLFASPREVRIRDILDGLRATVQVSGMTPETLVDDVRVDFTDQSAAYLAPLVEAVDILEAMVWASDGCVGHRQCTHSMEPWRRARALLANRGTSMDQVDKSAMHSSDSPDPTREEIRSLLVQSLAEIERLHTIFSPHETTASFFP